MAAGLNAVNREVIRGMVMGGEDEKEVKKMISQLVRYDGWDFQKNLNFVRELAANGYPQTAKHLAEYISN